MPPRKGNGCSPQFPRDSVAAALAPPPLLKLTPHPLQGGHTLLPFHSIHRLPSKLLAQTMLSQGSSSFHACLPERHLRIPRRQALDEKPEMGCEALKGGIEKRLVSGGFQCKALGIIAGELPGNPPDLTEHPLQDPQGTLPVIRPDHPCQKVARIAQPPAQHPEGALLARERILHVTELPPIHDQRLPRLVNNLCHHATILLPEPIEPVALQIPIKTRSADARDGQLFVHRHGVPARLQPLFHPPPIRI